MTDLLKDLLPQRLISDVKETNSVQNEKNTNEGNTNNGPEVGQSKETYTNKEDSYDDKEMVGEMKPFEESEPPEESKDHSVQEPPNEMKVIKNKANWSPINSVDQKISYFQNGVSFGEEEPGPKETEDVPKEEDTNSINLTDDLLMNEKYFISKPKTKKVRLSNSIIIREYIVNEEPNEESSGGNEVSVSKEKNEEEGPKVMYFYNGVFLNEDAIDEFKEKHYKELDPKENLSEDDNPINLKNCIPFEPRYSYIQESIKNIRKCSRFNKRYSHIKDNIKKIEFNGNLTIYELPLEVENNENVQKNSEKEHQNLEEDIQEIEEESDGGLSDSIEAEPETKLPSPLDYIKEIKRRPRIEEKVKNMLEDEKEILEKFHITKPHRKQKGYTSKRRRKTRKNTFGSKKISKASPKISYSHKSPKKNKTVFDTHEKLKLKGNIFDFSQGCRKTKNVFNFYKNVNLSEKETNSHKSKPKPRKKKIVEKPNSNQSTSLDVQTRVLNTSDGFKPKLTKKELIQLFSSKESIQKNFGEEGLRYVEMVEQLDDQIKMVLEFQLQYMLMLFSMEYYDMIDAIHLEHLLSSVDIDSMSQNWDKIIKKNEELNTIGSDVRHKIKSNYFIGYRFKSDNEEKKILKTTVGDMMAATFLQRLEQEDIDVYGNKQKPIGIVFLGSIAAGIGLVTTLMPIVPLALKVLPKFGKILGKLVGLIQKGALKGGGLFGTVGSVLQSMIKVVNTDTVAKAGKVSGAAVKAVVTKENAKMAGAMAGKAAKKFKDEGGPEKVSDLAGGLKKALLQNLKAKKDGSYKEAKNEQKQLAQQQKHANKNVGRKKKRRPQPSQRDNIGSTTKNPHSTDLLETRPHVGNKENEEIVDFMVGINYKKPPFSDIENLILAKKNL